MNLLLMAAGQTGFAFLLIETDPVLVGTAKAIQTSGAPLSSFANPAVMVSPSVEYSHLFWGPGFMVDSLGLAIPLKVSNSMTLDFKGAFNFLYSDPIPLTVDSPDEAGEAVYMASWGGAYAGTTLKIGITTSSVAGGLKYAYQRFYEYSSFALAIDGGAVLNLNLDKPYLPKEAFLTVKNLGYGRAMGSSGEMPPVSLGAGVTFHLPRYKKFKWTDGGLAGISIEYPYGYYFRFRMGLDYVFFRHYHLRAGFRWEGPESGFLSFGFSAAVNRFSFDFAFSHLSAFGLAFNVGFRYFL